MLFTRCPGCQAVYELDAAVLAEASGVVRCGNCGKTFNTLSHLFAEHPDEKSEAIRGGGMPPLLEHPDLVQAELPVAVLEPEPEDAPAADGMPAGLPDGRPWRLPGGAWPAACAVLLLALVVQTWMLWQTPGSPLARWAGGAGVPIQVNPNEAIQIISRDMHRHPSLDDAIIVSATLRNQESFAVAFPVLEVRFYDASQQTVGARRLEPQEYLRDHARAGEGLAPGTILPLILEFVVAGSEPSGFQIRFY